MAAPVGATAHAHAVLLDQSPADGAVMAVAPATVTLRFNETVTPVLLRVLDGSGHAVTGPGDVAELDTTVTIRLPPLLPSGTYVATYRVISADSHPVGGSFVFAVGTAPPDRALAAAQDTASDSLWTAIAVAVRAIFYAALLIAAGGALFAILVVRQPLDAAACALVRWTAAVAALAIILDIGAEAALASEVPLAGFFAPAVWRLGLASTLGPSAATTLTGLALLAGATLSSHRIARFVLGLGAVIAVAALALTGHAAAAPPSWLAAPALALHALCAAYWIGALPPLDRALAGDLINAAILVRRFSALAIAAVTVLAMCGVTLAILQVAAPDALISTSYGVRLLAKLAAVALLLLCAALNKWRFTPRLARGDRAAAVGLRRVILCELLLAGAIVIATAMLGQTTPPRALLEASDSHMHHAQAGYTVAALAGARMAMIEVSPAAPGPNRVTVTLIEDGRPIAIPSIDLYLSLPAFGIEAREHKAAAVAQGVFGGDPIAFPVAGPWQIEIEAPISDFANVDFVAAVPIGPRGSGSDSDSARASIAIADACVRAAPSSAALYLTIANKGTADDRLIGATTPAARDASLHVTLDDNGISRMRPLDAVEVRSGETVAFRPGGIHLMLTDLAQPLQPGLRIAFMLQFQNAGSVAVEAPVAPLGAAGCAFNRPRFP